MLGARSRIVLGAALVGALTVGVLSRLVMLLLVRLNPGADGVISDDGFEMGRFTVSGSLNLLVIGIAFGVLSGVLYLLLEPLQIGPVWFRTLSVSVGAGTVAATQVVHDDGIDFVLLDPLALAVGLFVLLPVVHVALVDLLARRVRSARSQPAREVGGPVPWLLRGGLAVLFVVAVASLARDVATLHDLSG